MLYIGNLFGLYFPFDFCFVTGASTVLAFLPRFIPIILLAIVSAITSYFKKWVASSTLYAGNLMFARAKIRMWHGVWALLELLYTPLVYTCVSLLHCPELPDNNAEEDVNVSLSDWFQPGIDNAIHVLYVQPYNCMFFSIYSFLFLIEMVLGWQH